MSVTLLFWLLYIRLTFGYRKGSPISCCNSMEPRHGGSAQTTASPYVLSLSSTTYLPNQEIEITLSSPTHTFSGFLLEAFGPENNKIVGSYGYSDEIKMIQCITPQGNALTQTSLMNRQSQSLTVTWSSEYAVGDVHFYVTVIQSKRSFWMDVKSSLLQDATLLQPKPSIPTSRNSKFLTTLGEKLITSLMTNHHSSMSPASEKTSLGSSSSFENVKSATQSIQYAGTMTDHGASSISPVSEKTSKGSSFENVEMSTQSGQSSKKTVNSDNSSITVKNYNDTMTAMLEKTSAINNSSFSVTLGTG